MVIENKYISTVIEVYPLIWQNTRPPSVAHVLYQAGPHRQCGLRLSGPGGGLVCGWQRCIKGLNQAWTLQEWTPPDTALSGAFTGSLDRGLLRAPLLTTPTVCPCASPLMSVS